MLNLPPPPSTESVANGMKIARYGRSAAGLMESRRHQNRPKCNMQHAINDSNIHQIIILRKALLP